MAVRATERLCPQAKESDVPRFLPTNKKQIEKILSSCYNLTKILDLKVTIMKLYAPSYYKKFKCIADRCEHSCCIGWEIDIDSITLEKYKKQKKGYALAVLESISMEEEPHFILADRERCPHLDERGLCKIITNMGEDYLCDICREHPRFYNYTSVAEVGIGMSCGEAARLILSSADYDAIEEIGSVDVENDGILFDGVSERSKIYALLRDKSKSYADRLENIYSEYLIDTPTDKTCLAKLEGLEYLDEGHRILFEKYSSKLRPSVIETDEYLERFLAYLIYRHTTEAIDYEDFCIRLGFCLFCERLLASLIFTERAESLFDVARLASIISEEIEYSEENTEALIQ